jgi:putative addiction module component (TIGR02574 family)
MESVITIISIKIKKLNLLQMSNTMAAITIRQKLYEYIRLADDKKVKAIYTMVEDEIAEKGYDYWNDKAFIEELDKRSANYKNGKTKAIAWEDAKAQILNSNRPLKK